MLDLDAIKPKTFTVRVGGRDYELSAADALPVKAMLDCFGVQSHTKPEEQIRAVLAFFHEYAPEFPAASLRADQLLSVFCEMVGGTKRAATVDPPKTTEGVPGEVLGATPCKLP